MKVYKYTVLEALNAALADFEKKRIKIVSVRPVAEGQKVGDCSDFKAVFYVTTEERNTEETFQKN